MTHLKFPKISLFMSNVLEKSCFTRKMFFCKSKIGSIPQFFLIFNKSRKKYAYTRYRKKQGRSKTFSESVITYRDVLILNKLFKVKQPNYSCLYLCLEIIYICTYSCFRKSVPDDISKYETTTCLQNRGHYVHSK